MTRKTRKAGALALGGAGALVAIPAAGGLFSSEALPAFVAAGMLVFLLCCGRALRLCGIEDLPFDSKKRCGAPTESDPDRGMDRREAPAFLRGRTAVPSHRVVPKIP